MSAGYSFRDLEQFASRFYPQSMLDIAPYWYTLQFAALAPGVTATQNLNFQANADFICTALSIWADANTKHGITESSQVLPFVRALITDSGSSQPMMNVATNVMPLTLPTTDGPDLVYPRFFSGRSSLQVALTNYSDTETYNLDVVFTGVNVRAIARQG